MPKRALIYSAKLAKSFRAWFIEWLRPENRKPFYVTVSLVVFCIMGLVVTGMEQIDDAASLEQQIAQRQRNDVKTKLFGFGGAIITGIYLLISRERDIRYTHEANHRLRGDFNDATLQMRVAVAVLEDLKSQVEPLVKATNGNMSDRINEVFEKAREAFATPVPGQSEFPGTMQELERMMDKRCGTIANTAATEAVRMNMAELRAQGLIPPSNLGVQT